MSVPDNKQPCYRVYYTKTPMDRSEGVAGDPDTGYFWDDEEPVDWDEYLRERELYGREDY